MPLPIDTHIALALCMMLGAALYSSVGHAGASAYIALMALFGMPAAVMRPTALVLNIVVGTLASLRFASAGLFHWPTLWPLLVGAIPAAFIGGSIDLPGHIYRPLVGVVLLVSAARFLWPTEFKTNAEWRTPPVGLGIAVGAAIGLLAGLTGTGGGIFLSPILLFCAWASTRTASGIAAVFILCNSAAGLLGNLVSVRALPPELPLYIAGVVTGGLIGTTLGIRLPVDAILKALGIVLVIAGTKLIGLH